MARVLVTLTDQNGQTLSLDDTTLGKYVDLNLYNFADKATHVSLANGPQYQPGDHIRLLDDKQKVIDTDTVTADIALTNDLDLHTIDFADKAAGLLFELAPNPLAGNPTRVDLYDRVNQANPNITLYSWESTNGSINLNDLYFASKAARVDVFSANANAQITLEDHTGATVTLGTGFHDLNQLRFPGGNWADRTVVVYF